MIATETISIPIENNGDFYNVTGELTVFLNVFEGKDFEYKGVFTWLERFGNYLNFNSAYDWRRSPKPLNGNLVQEFLNLKSLSSLYPFQSYGHDFEDWNIGDLEIERELKKAYNHQLNSLSFYKEGYCIRRAKIQNKLFEEAKLSITEEKLQNVAEISANWWTKKAGSFKETLMQAYQRTPKISPEILNEFNIALKNDIIKSFKNSPGIPELSLTVDPEPTFPCSKLLLRTLSGKSIKLPINTQMWINPWSVRIRNGYGAREEYLHKEDIFKL